MFKVISPYELYYGKRTFFEIEIEFLDQNIIVFLKTGTLEDKNHFAFSLRYREVVRFQFRSHCFLAKFKVISEFFPIRHITNIYILLCWISEVEFWSRLLFLTNFKDTLSIKWRWKKFPILAAITGHYWETWGKCCRYCNIDPKNGLLWHYLQSSSTNHKVYFWVVL